MQHAQDAQVPRLRWGIIGTGLISSWFVQDLIIERSDAGAHHTIQAIGSSSKQKGQAFTKKFCPGQPSEIYGFYDQVYQDPNVDIVYIGTPHAFHKRNCLDAIAANKHVLCEKPFTVNAIEAEEVIEAAKAKGVYVMEAMWTRFHPLLIDLRKKLFDERIIGNVHRTFCDFGLDMNIQELPSESRLKSLELGAGSLLDIGIYSLTWGLLTLDAKIGHEAEEPKLVAVQSLSDKVDVSTSMLLQYPLSGKQGILTSTTLLKTEERFCRIEGSKGCIVVEGHAASAPDRFIVFGKSTLGSDGKVLVNKGHVFEYEKQGRGFYWEADAVARDIAAGLEESATMPHVETLRLMRMMDQVRSQGGAYFPQDRLQS